MADPIKWQGLWTVRGQLITTGLNSLGGSGSRTTVGSCTVLHNETNLDQYGKILMAFSTGGGAAGGYIGIYMLTAPDGTNFEDGSDSVDPGIHNLIAQIPVRPTITSAQLLTSPVFALQPAPTIFIVINQCNSNLAASGNTLSLFTSNDQVN